MKGLPRYKSHKIVAAAKIIGIEDKLTLLLAVPGADEKGSPTLMTVDWITRHKPQVGGYYVVYDDGYGSYSPAKAFEEGYKPIEPAVPPDADDITIAASITRAMDILATPDMLFDTRAARKIITGLIAGLSSSACYFKAMQKGEEVFVLRQSDRAAPDTIASWANIASDHGCGPDKVADARAIAVRWRAQPLDDTKWPT